MSIARTILPWTLGLGLCLGPVVAAPSAVAQSVHSGGVGACSFCHVMHDSRDGQPVRPGAGNGGAALLVQATASDVCLSCHADEYGAVLAANPLAPPPTYGGGNFVFLKEDNLNDGSDGLTNPIGGDAAGHNLTAVLYGLAPDTRYATAPGGTYPASAMGCTSCHDPHGNANYRMLRGAGPVPGGSQPFLYPAPGAVGLPLDGPPEVIGNHNAYLSGMSQWCANCHPDLLNNMHRMGGSFRHKSQVVFKPGHRKRYNEYNGAADPFGGQTATAYLVEVPFEDAAATVTSTSGPGTSGTIMCLSCHRAHASSAPMSGRWDFNVEFLVDDGGVSGSYPLSSPYPDPGQTSLCYKCHTKIPMPVGP